MDKPSLADLVYLHRLFTSNQAKMGLNEQSRVIEKLMEQRLREAAAVDGVRIVWSS